MWASSSWELDTSRFLRRPINNSGQSNDALTHDYVRVDEAEADADRCFRLLH